MTAQITKGSGNVTVNGLPVARMNDTTNGVTESEAGSIATAAAGQVVTSTLSNMQQAIVWGNTTINSVNGVFQMTAPLTIPPFSGSLPGANNAVPTIDLVQRMITSGEVVFPITVAEGGTGANNAAQARANLGLAAAGGSLSGTYPNPSVANSGVSAGSYGDSSHVASLTIGADGRVSNATNVAISSTSPVGAAGGMLTGSYPNPTANSAYAFSQLQVGTVNFYSANGEFAGYVGNTDATNLYIRPMGSRVVNVLGNFTATNFSGNSSGVNTGDQTIPTTLPPSGAAGGSLSGTYPNPSVANSGVVANTYGDSSHVASLTIGADGRVSNATNVAISSTSPSGPAGGSLSGTYPNPSVANSGVVANTYGDSGHVASLTIGADGRVSNATNVAISSTSPVGAAGGMLTGSYPNPTANSAYAFSQLLVGSANGYTTITSPSSNYGGYVRFCDASGAAATYIGNANSSVGMLGAYANHSWTFLNTIVGNPGMTSNTSPFVAMPKSGYLATWPGGASISSGPDGASVIATATGGGTGLSAVAYPGGPFIAGNTTSTFFSVNSDGTSSASAFRVVGTPSGWAPSTQGGYMVWNYSTGGRTDFVNNQGGGTGGWTFTNANSSGGSQVQMVSISGTPGLSSLVANGSVCSTGAYSALYFQDRSGSTQWAWYNTGNTAYLFNGSGNAISVSPAGTVSANIAVSSFINMGTAGGGECHIFMNMANNTPYLYFNSGSFGMYSGTTGMYFSVDASVGTFAMQHNATVAGSLTVGASNIMMGDGWFRSAGNTGWYSQTWGIGIYCTDSTYVRTYNNAKMAANDFVISSDINLKTSIDDFDFRGPLRPRSFNWKSDNEHDIGFIAQEVEVLYPECVSTLRQEDGTRIKQLSYQKLSTVLAAQVNLLSDQVTNLNKQIESMQSQINQLSGNLRG